MQNWDIQSFLNHRAPFLFVAEVLELIPGKRAVARSNAPRGDLVALGCEQITVPLWYVAEFMAQTGALAVLAGVSSGEKTLMTGIDDFSLLAQATTREPLRAEVELLGEKRGIGKRRGTVWQGEQLVAEGLIWYARTK